MTDLQKGNKIKLIDHSDDELIILDKIGSGGQGTVYKVKFKNKEYALKWYHNSYLKGLTKIEDFYQNLINNCENGAPTKEFLWPLAVTEKKDGSFGYLMELRPSEYQSFSKILNAVVRFKNIATVVNSSLNIINAFQCLHRKGYSYQDLNDGNFFVNPTSGNVLICDNDNVAPYSSGFGIKGKSRYMAPEIVKGKTSPNMDTDLFSLSVILFMFYFLSHPLEGERVAKCPCLTDKNEKEFYGINPIFVWDPNNDTNRPVRGIHNNAIKLWPIFPKYMQEAFVRAFTQGIDIISQRIMENEWKKIFNNLKDDMICCSKCQENNFVSLSENGIITCCNCGFKIKNPPVLSNINSPIALCAGKNITERHIREGGDDSKVLGTVVTNKNNTELLGIRNISNELWFIDDDVTIKTNEVVPIKVGVKITFRNKQAVIK